MEIAPPAVAIRRSWAAVRRKRGARLL